MTNMLGSGCRVSKRVEYRIIMYTCVLSNECVFSVRQEAKIEAGNRYYSFHPKAIHEKGVSVLDSEELQQRSTTNQLLEDHMISFANSITSITSFLPHLFHIFPTETWHCFNAEVSPRIPKALQLEVFDVASGRGGDQLKFVKAQPCRALGVDSL